MRGRPVHGDRDGLLRARRTPGGQRRYPQPEVEAFLREKMGFPSSPPPSDAPTAQRSSGGRDSSRSARARIRKIGTAASFPCDPELEEAQSELGILKAQHESQSIRRAMQEEEDQAVRRAEEARLRQELSGRLQDLKSYGRSLAGPLPPDWQARVVADLEGHVTAQQFPAAISEWDARAFIRARVGRFLRRHQASVEQQQETQRRQRRLEDLIRGGETSALIATLEWAYEDGERARQAAKRELRSRVGADWTEAEVRALVNDILDDCRQDEDDLQESEIEDTDDRAEDDNLSDEDYDEEDENQEDGNEDG